QSGADDRIAPLLVGQRRGADAKCQHAGESGLSDSFGDIHVYSPVPGRPCDAARQIRRVELEIARLASKLASGACVSPADWATVCINCFSRFLPEWRRIIPISGMMK